MGGSVSFMWVSPCGAVPDWLAMSEWLFDWSHGCGDAACHIQITFLGLIINVTLFFDAAKL